MHHVRVSPGLNSESKNNGSVNKIGENDSIKFFTFNIDRKSIIEIAPDSLAIEKLKKEMGEDDFYTIAGDWAYYQAQLGALSDSLNINFISTEKRRVEIRTPNKTVRFDADTASKPWNYFYFDGEKLSRKSIFELLELGSKRK